MAQRQIDAADITNGCLCNYRKGGCPETNQSNQRECFSPGRNCFSSVQHPLIRIFRIHFNYYVENTATSEYISSLDTRSNVKVLLNPRGFFEQRPNGGTWMSTAVIIAASGVASVSGLLAVTVGIAQLLPQAVVSLLVISSVIVFTVTVVSQFLLWFVFFYYLFTLSKHFGNVQRFSALTRHVGWGFTPLLIGGVVSGAIALSVVSGLPAESAGQVQEIVESIRRHRAFTYSSLLMILCQIWSGIIWTFAVQQTQDVSTDEAAIIISIPLSVFIFI